MNGTKLYLVSGFLGAGKTSFLKRVLDENPDKKIGIIMNEFGRISIDGPLLDAPGIQMVELTRGSIFCSCLKLSFIDALIQMADKALDFVFVESSGLADPSNIGEYLSYVKLKVAHPYRYAGAICIVDGLHFLDQFSQIETIVRQIRCSDLVIISKVDAISHDTIATIKTTVTGIHPRVKIIESDHYNIDFSFIGQELSDGEPPLPIESLNTEENKPKTIILNYEGVLESESLLTILRNIAPSSYRIKGFVALESGHRQIDVVGEKIDNKPSEQVFDQSTLVFISKIGPQIIKIIDHAWRTNTDKPMKLSN